MTKNSLTAIGIVLVLVAIAGNTYIGLHVNSRVSSQTQKGAEQRVTTISQRCDLTAKIVEVLVKDDPSRVPSFKVSYGKCIVGLQKAERLAGRTAAQIAAR